MHAKTMGRPGYDPADLLKLYICGYLNRVRSSRRLEAEMQRNVEVIWLLRHLRPDFKTIADFYGDNWSAYRQLFREFVLLCRQLDLFGRELLAVDGTRIKAVNSKDRDFTRAALAKITGDADETSADGGDVGRDNKLTEKIVATRGRRKQHKVLLDKLDRPGEDQISLTDTDAWAMARMTKVGMGYNVQLAVDTKHNLIAEQEVSNQMLDLGLLAPTLQLLEVNAEQARRIFIANRADYALITASPTYYDFLHGLGKFSYIAYVVILQQREWRFGRSAGALRPGASADRPGT